MQPRSLASWCTALHALSRAWLHFKPVQVTIAMGQLQGSRGEVVRFVATQEVLKLQVQNGTYAARTLLKGGRNGTQDAAGADAESLYQRHVVSS